MIIRFTEMEPTRNEKFKGGEGALDAKMFWDGKNRILHGCLEPGSSIGYHAHETSSEIIYVLSGEGTVLMDGETETVAAGDCHYCPQGHSHSMINRGPQNLIFFAVVPEHHE